MIGFILTQPRRYYLTRCGRGVMTAVTRFGLWRHLGDILSCDHAGTSSIILFRLASLIEIPCIRPVGGSP